MNQRYAKDLTERRIVQLSPLSAFADEVTLGPQIADPSEGTSTVTAENLQLRPGEPIPTAFRRNIKGSVFLSAGKVILGSQVTNVLIFCTTQKFDTGLFMQFGYDSCILINNATNFFRIISESIRNDFQYKGTFPCYYRPRTNHYLSKAASKEPYLLKEPKYSHQKEIRSIWQSKKDQTITRPVILECPELTKYCQIHV
jgi:hypothetical protein